MLPKQNVKPQFVYVSTLAMLVGNTPCFQWHLSFMPSCHIHWKNPHIFFDILKINTRFKHHSLNMATPQKPFLVINNGL